MNRFVAYFKILTFCVCLTFGIAYAEQSPVRYRRALVFPGGGFQTAIFLGMLEEAENQGQAPDVVVGSCGGAIAATIANILSTNEERRAFLESREFYELLQSNKLEYTSIFYGLWNVSKFVLDRLPFNDRVPNLFDGPLLAMPKEFVAPTLNKPFLTSGIRAVIIASRMHFSPEDVGNPRDGKKLLQEVFFTDEETAGLLRSVQSEIGTNFPESSVMQDTDVVLGVMPLVAARASVADPYYVTPIQIDGYYYMTGAIDLYPLNVAHRLANIVLMPFSSGFDSIERYGYHSAYRYEINEQLRRVTSKQATHWIDFSDQSEIYARYGFNPRPNWSMLEIQSRLPDNYDEYVERVRQLWQYGRERMREALQTEENSKAHIRKMDDGNTYPSLREGLGR
jgi:predicted acylesterase/phospholipase RssA